MKSAIYEYLEPTTEEKKALWQNAVFVFDTNVLLNMYRFSKKTRDALISSMRKKKDRIWIPYQVAYEFMDNRYEVIFESVKRYEDLRNEADAFIKHCIQQLRKKSSDTEVEQLRNQINEWLTHEQEKDLLISNPLEDAILNQLLELFDGQVGRKYSDEEMEQIKQEGKARYERGFPPGYKDGKKQISVNNDNNMYGDLILWKQIIDYSQKEKQDIIFVVNDKKEDWWNVKQGKTIGPRIELRKEFYEKTSKKFHMYTMESFLQFCNEEDGKIVADSILEEVISLDKERKRKVHKQQKKEMDLAKQIEELQKRIANKEEMIEILERQVEDGERSNSLQQKISQLYYGKNILQKRLSDLDKNL